MPGLLRTKTFCGKLKNTARRKVNPPQGFGSVKPPSVHMRILFQSLRHDIFSLDHAIHIALFRLARISCLIFRPCLGRQYLHECLCASAARHPSRANRLEVKGSRTAIETGGKKHRSGRLRDSGRPVQQSCHPREAHSRLTTGTLLRRFVPSSAQAFVVVSITV